MPVLPALLAILVLWTPTMAVGPHVSEDGYATPAPLYAPHSQISIIGDADFTPANGVTAGTGTSSDPFVVGGWDITVSTRNPGLLVRNTTAYFILESLSFNTTIGDPQIGSPGAITLYNATHGVIRNVVSEGQGNFVRVSLASDIAIVNTRARNVSTSSLPGGIVITSSSRITVAGNNLTRTAGGVTVDTSSDVSIVRNRFIEDDWAVSVTGSSHVTVAENNYTGGRGVDLSGNTNISVFHNNFFGPGIMGASWTRSANNSWDDGYPSGGNYWYNYTGVDRCTGPGQDICTGPDGIGDTPLVVGDAGWVTSWYGTDRYPLIEPFVWSIAPPLSVSAITATPSAVKVGEPTLLNVTVSGGSGTYSYRWNGLPLGCSSADASSVACTPTVAGDYLVTVTVTDSRGHTQSASLVITVSPTSTQPGVDATVVMLVAVVVGAPALFLIGLLVVLHLRRRKPRKQF